MRVPIAAGVAASVLCACASAQAADCFTYDAAGRLETATYATASQNSKLTYTLDKSGNRTSVATTATAPTCAAPPGGGIPNVNPIAWDDTAAVTAGSSVSVSVLANDSDADGDPLIVSAVGSAGKGTPAVSPGGASVAYSANAGTSGGDSFTYTVSDGRGGTAQATVSVTIASPTNQPPVAVNDGAGYRRLQIYSVNVLSNDSDPDGHPLTVIAVTQGAKNSAAIGSNGTTVVLENDGLTGSDSVTYTISDGHGGTATATISINVLP